MCVQIAEKMSKHLFFVSQSQGRNVIYRFLGTTEQSTSARALLQSLCAQLLINKGKHEDVENLPSSFQKLCDEFNNALNRSNDVDIFLDSLDQVQTNPYSSDLVS